MIYYIVVLVLSLGALLNVLISNKKEYIGFYLFCVGLIFIFGSLRYEVGADWFSYKGLFLDLDNWSKLYRAREEKLFMTLLFIPRFFTKNYSIAVFFIFSVSYFVKVYIINKYSSNVFLSYIIYLSTVFILYDINGIRQGLAISVTLFSITAIVERRFYKFCLLIIIAALFHTSALVFFPFYWIATKRISTKQILLFTIGVLIISIPIRSFMLSNPLFTFLLATDSFAHYNTYLDDKEVNKSVELLSVSVFQRFLFLIIILFNYEKINAKEDVKRVFLNGYFISVIVFLLFSFSSEFAARLGFYYKSVELILLPLVVSSQYSRFMKVVYLLLFVILSIVAIQRLLSVPDGGLLPYKVYFFTKVQ